MHWATKAKLVAGIKAKAWGLMVNARNEAGTSRATEPCTLRITVYVCGRLYDEGNLHANVKAHEDAAVAAGWIVDDAPAWCHLEVRQERVKTRIEQRIQIEVD
jgi:hypothetical protein